MAVRESLPGVVAWGSLQWLCARGVRVWVWHGVKVKFAAVDNGNHVLSLSFPNLCC